MGGRQGAPERSSLAGNQETGRAREAAACLLRRFPLSQPQGVLISAAGPGTTATAPPVLRLEWTRSLPRTLAIGCWSTASTSKRSPQANHELNVEWSSNWPPAHWRTARCIALMTGHWKPSSSKTLPLREATAKETSAFTASRTELIAAVELVCLTSFERFIVIV